LSRLTSLFGIRDGVTRAAQGGDRARFAEQFACSTLYFLCLPERFAAGLPASATQQEILAQIEQAATDLSQSQGFQPFVYLSEGQRRLPVFSSNDLVAEFAKWYALHTQRIIPLQALGVDGATIVPAFKDCDVVVLNDRTKHEYVLSATDVELVTRAGGPTTG